MNRTEIEAQYSTSNGRIVSPGKFENEPVYSVYFWDAWLNGMSDQDDGEIIRFDVMPEDIAEFPELRKCYAVFLSEDDNGFVHCKALEHETVLD